MASNYWPTTGGHVPTKISAQFFNVTISCDFETDNLILKNDYGHRKIITRHEIEAFYKNPRDAIKTRIAQWEHDTMFRFGPSWFSAYQRALAEARARQ